MPARTRFENGGATLYIVLRPYLEHLEALERSKPETARRTVPTIDDIAGEVGVSRTSIYNLASGDVQQLNLKIAGRIIAALRARGFRMEITDLLAYRE
jgi:DNA-binding XRE family transcriptional regulator